MQSRPARVVRGAIAGTLATLAAAISHTAAGAEAPSALALLVGACFGTLVGLAATGRRPSTARLAVLTGASQAAFHLAFVSLGTSATIVGGHHGARLHVAPLDVVGGGHAHADAGGMWLAHAIAAVATLAILRFAEASAWTLLVALAGELRRLAAVRLPAPSPSGRPATLVDSPALRVALRDVGSSCSRRGPPALVSA